MKNMCEGRHDSTRAEQNLLSAVYVHKTYCNDRESTPSDGNYSYGREINAS